GGVERVAIDMRHRKRRQRVVANQARGAAFAAASRLDVEVAEAIPAKTARADWCSHSVVRTHLPHHLCELRNDKEHQQIMLAVRLMNLKFLRRDYRESGRNFKFAALVPAPARSR